MVNTMDQQSKDVMPSGVQVILGWPICRKTRDFSLDEESYWHPYSAERLVTMAREWYWAHGVPEDWQQRLVANITEDQEQELRIFLSTPYPLYYRCPRCSLYI